MKEHCLPTCCFWFAQFGFLKTQDHLPRSGTTHNRQKPSIPTLVKNMPYRLFKGNLMETFTQSKFHLPDNSSLYQVDQNTYAGQAPTQSPGTQTPIQFPFTILLFSCSKYFHTAVCFSQCLANFLYNHFSYAEIHFYKPTL